MSVNARFVNQKWKKRGEQLKGEYVKDLPRILCVNCLGIVFKKLLSLGKGVRVFLCLAAACFVWLSMLPEILEEIEYYVQEAMIA